jgi:hypothetical protein
MWKGLCFRDIEDLFQRNKGLNKFRKLLFYPLNYETILRIKEQANKDKISPCIL